MKRFFQNLGYRFQVFMQGRYGTDELSYFLSVAGLVLLLLSCFSRRLSVLYLLALVMLIWSWYRSLSKNIYKRQQERNRYLEIRRKISQKIALRRTMWRERNTHSYYKCPQCKVMIRVPKPGKGKRISITCPRCHYSFEKKT